MSNFGLSCDVCGREVQGYTWVNGMRFCAKCYQETFGNKNMTENLNNMYEAYLKILNEKDQRIAELEEQLKYAIVPKFKIGQEVWYISDTNKVFSFNINKIGGLNFRYYDDNGFWLHEEELFATKEEALKKLEELKGENK